MGHCGRRSRWDRILGALARTHNIAKICERYGGGVDMRWSEQSRSNRKRLRKRELPCGKLLLNSRLILSTRIYRAINSSISSRLLRHLAVKIRGPLFVQSTSSSDAHANPQIFLRDVLSISRDVDPRLDGHHHTRLERTRFLSK